MADLTEFFDFEGSSEFDALWEEIAQQLDEPPSSSRKSAEASGSGKQSKGDSEIAEPSLLKTLLTSSTKKERNSSPLQNFQQKKEKMSMPLQVNNTLNITEKPINLSTCLQNTDKCNPSTKRPFQKFSTHTATNDSTPPCTYSPALDENYPPTTTSDSAPGCTYSSALDENYPPTSTDSFQDVEDSILTTFRRNNQKKYNLLERRFSDPNLTTMKEFKVLKALHRRISKDIKQSEIIVNYLTDNYGSESAKKRVKFSSLC